MPPLNPSDRKDVRKLEKAAAQAEASRIAYTRRIMSEPQGREWMHDLLARCHVFSTPFVRGAADLTAFNCGQQNIGYQTFADVVNHSPNEYVLMMQEASIREISNGRRTDDTARERSASASTDGRVEGSEPDLDPAVWADEYGPIPEARTE